MMKTRLLILAAAAAMLAACSFKPSETTVISGEFGDNAPGAVSISIPDVVDTVVTLSDKGAFCVEIPTTTTDMAYIEAGDMYSGAFVADGTALKVTAQDDEALVVTSAKSARHSIQARYNEYQNWIENTFMEEYSGLMEESEAAKGDDAATAEVEEKYDALMETLNKRNRHLINANKDNVLALVGLSNSDFDDAETEQIILSLSEEIQQRREIQEMLSSVQSRKGTAEGEMFTDFTIVQDPSKPEATTVKLSDYVGKGKYILVDFWASWCGPCKREIPNLKNVYNTYKGDNFDVLSIAVWDTPQASVDTAKAYGIEWNHIINAQQIPTEIYGIQGIPHIILFGPDGTIIKRDLRGSEIGKEVAKALGK